MSELRLVLQSADMSLRKSNFLTRKAGGHTVFLGRSGPCETVEEMNAQIQMIRGIVATITPEAHSDEEVIGAFISISQLASRSGSLVSLLYQLTGYNVSTLSWLFAKYLCKRGEELVLADQLLSLFGNEEILGPRYVPSPKVVEKQATLPYPDAGLLYTNTRVRNIGNIPVYVKRQSKRR